MRRDEVIETIQGLLGDNFGLPAARVTESATFRRELGLDSLDVVDFVFFLHSAFGYRAELKEYRDLHTVGQLVDFVLARQP